MVDDCMENGLTVEEGGAHYNFTGPQGFGVANVGNALYAVDRLVFRDRKVTMAELKKCLKYNFGQGLDASSVTELRTEADRAAHAGGEAPGEAEIAEETARILRNPLTPVEQRRFGEIRQMILDLPKFGNDDPEVDEYAREGAYLYTRPLENYRNPRGGQFQAGLYPVSANVPLGAQTGATPDGRLAHQPVADGVSPFAGTDVNGPTAACNSVARLDHGIASNGTLFNMKFHPSALAGAGGLDSFIALIRAFFDQKGMHMQFNVVDRKTLLDAQEHPERYQHLVVRVAGYSALFTTLSRSLQDDIISRTEQVDAR
jgi:formate C-acetyltransferase